MQHHEVWSKSLDKNCQSSKVALKYTLSWWKKEVKHLMFYIFISVSKSFFDNSKAFSTVKMKEKYWSVCIMSMMAQDYLHPSTHPLFFNLFWEMWHSVIYYWSNPNIICKYEGYILSFCHGSPWRTILETKFWLLCWDLNHEHHFICGINVQRTPPPKSNPGRIKWAQSTAILSKKDPNSVQQQAFPIGFPNEIA